MRQANNPFLAPNIQHFVCLFIWAPVPFQVDYLQSQYILQLLKVTTNAEIETKWSYPWTLGSLWDVLSKIATPSILQRRSWLNLPVQMQVLKIRFVTIVQMHLCLQCHRWPKLPGLAIGQLAFLGKSWWCQVAYFAHVQYQDNANL